MPLLNSAMKSSRAKPSAPLPMIVRRALRRVLPQRIYLRYVGRHDQQTRRIWSVLAGKVAGSQAILDVGAHVGEFSILARQANPDSVIAAFEPNASSFEMLQSTSQNYGLTAVHSAVSSLDGEVTFNCRTVSGHIVTEKSGVDDRDRLETVASLRLDTWLKVQGWKIGLLKGDVEQSEPQVFQGMSQCLSQDLPIILCEVLTDEVGAAVESELPADYVFYAIDENRGLQARDRICRISWRDLNWLLLPRSKRDDVIEWLGIRCP